MPLKSYLVIRKILNFRETFSHLRTLIYCYLFAESEYQLSLQFNKYEEVCHVINTYTYQFILPSVSMVLVLFVLAFKTISKMRHSAEFTILKRISTFLLKTYSNIYSSYVVIIPMFLYYRVFVSFTTYTLIGVTLSTMYVKCSLVHGFITVAF